MHPTTDRTNRRPAFAGWLTALILVATTAVLAQDGQRMNGFLKTGDYLLELEGSPLEGAEVYRSQAAQAVLIVAADLEAPVLIRPRFRTVEKVNLLKLSENPDGSIDLLPDPTYAQEPPFTVEGSDVLFQVGGLNLALKPKPALVGFHGPSSIYEHSPEYEQRAGYYEPSQDLVQELMAQPKSVEVKVFFGTWCPACGQLVPGVLKLAEQTRGSKIQFSFYGLARQFSGDSEAKRFGIKSVPTGVVLVDGKEVGRLTGNDWRRPEKALKDLIDS